MQLAAIWYKVGTCGAAVPLTLQKAAAAQERNWDSTCVLLFINPTRIIAGTDFVLAVCFKVNLNRAILVTE